MVRMRTFARNQTLRTGQNRIANVRMRFANVRLRISNKGSHAICELRMKWKWALKLLSFNVTSSNDRSRLTTSVPASASFIELDATTALHLGLIIKLTENPAKIAAEMARPIRSQDLLLVI